MPGATILDLESILLCKNISVINKHSFRVGTEEYRFDRNVSQYRDQITPGHIKIASDFALATVGSDKPSSIRLKGICGADCMRCNNFNRLCRGAGFSCWSGRKCNIFNCCIIRKSYSGCEDCNRRSNFILIKNKITLDEYPNINASRSLV
jgi:hypothetical protein